MREPAAVCEGGCNRRRACSAAESAKRIEELEKELVLLKEERESLERVTMDEIFEREPEMR